MEIRPESGVASLFPPPLGNGAYHTAFRTAFDLRARGPRGSLKKKLFFCPASVDRPSEQPIQNAKDGKKTTEKRKKAKRQCPHFVITHARRVRRRRREAPVRAGDSIPDI